MYKNVLKSFLCLSRFYRFRRFSIFIVKVRQYKYNSEEHFYGILHRFLCYLKQTGNTSWQNF